MTARRTWDLETTFAGRPAVVEGINDPAPKDQDRAGVAADCLVVADGVTPIDPAQGATVQHFADAVVRAFLDRRGEPLPDALRHAVGAAPSGVSEVPACALGAARVADGGIELSSIADSAAAARLRDGTVVTCLDDRVGSPSSGPAVRFHRMILDGATPEEARRAMIAGHGERRARRNRPGSYWVVADDPAVAEEARTVSLHPDDVETVLVYSDGFSRAWEELGVLADVAEALDPATSLRAVVDDIRTAERWRARSPLPLFGETDDATVLRMRLR